MSKKNNSTGFIKKSSFNSKSDVEAFECFRKGIGERLLKLRNAQKLGLLELEVKLQTAGIDISHSSLFRYEIGETTINIYTLYQLANFYQVSIDYLIYGEEMKPVEELQLLLNGTSEEFQRFILSNMKHLIKTSKEFISGN